MTRTDRPGAGPGFWACPRCGTPNPAAAYLTNCVACGTPRSAARVAGAATPRPAARARARRGWARPALAVAVGLYAAAVLSALAWIRFGFGPTWALATLLFLPRVLLIGPAVVLLPLALILRARRQAGVVVATALVVAWPVMGFNIPWHRLLQPAPPGLTLRVMTFNLAQRGWDAEGLIRLIERERVDLISFQEIQPDPRLTAYLAEGWYRNRWGTIASRLPILEELPEPVDESLDQDRWQGQFRSVRLATHLDSEIVFGMVHLPTMRPGFDRLMGRDTGGLEVLMPYWEHRLRKVHALITSRSGGRPFLLAGDFNMPPENPAFAALPTPLRSAFADAGWGYGYTRPASRSFAAIDHIFASPEWTVRRCWVGPDLGSDHLPLLAEVVLPLPAPNP